jgi:bacterioferritin-associated ferredoxin
MGSGRNGFGVLNITSVIVCHCFGVSDRRILAEAGLGAGSSGDIARRCGAGSDCGGCTNRIEDLLEIRLVGEPTDTALAS